MLGEPGLVETQLLGEQDLLEQFLESLALRHPGPCLVITESPKPHAMFFLLVLAATQAIDGSPTQSTNTFDHRPCSDSKHFPYVVCLIMVRYFLRRHGFLRAASMQRTHGTPGAGSLLLSPRQKLVCSHYLGNIPLMPLALAMWISSRFLPQPLELSFLPSPRETNFPSQKKLLPASRVLYNLHEW